MLGRVIAAVLVTVAVGATGPAGMLQDLPQGQAVRKLVHQPDVHLSEAARLRMRRMMP